MGLAKKEMKLPLSGGVGIAILILLGIWLFGAGRRQKRVILWELLLGNRFAEAVQRRLAFRQHWKFLLILSGVWPA